MKQHNWSFRILNYQVCSKCGLIALKNKSTIKEMNRQCKGSEKEDDN